MAGGRPREFDVDEALEKALTLFWTKGYEATSLSDLVEAMGIKKPSLYAAFGSKEDLFFKALERYRERIGAAAASALALPSARAGIEAYLRALADFQSAPDAPRGCLFVQGALVGGEQAHRVAQALGAIRAAGIEKMRQCLLRGREQGELPPDTDVDALARYFGTVSNGISVQAASGMPVQALQESISIAMRAWPRAGA